MRAPVADGPLTAAPVTPAPALEGAVLEGAVQEGTVQEGAVQRSRVQEGPVTRVAGTADGAAHEAGPSPVHHADAPAKPGSEQQRTKLGVAGPPSPGQPGEGCLDDEVAAWGTVLGSFATVLTTPVRGPGDTEAPDDAGLARWRPSAVEQNAAPLPETPRRAVAGPPPGPPPDPPGAGDEAVVAAGNREDPDEEAERTAADLLVEDASQWGRWQGDPGDL
jgi:hypothetical protein